MSFITSSDKENLIDIAKTHGITWLALFGSAARGEATSDSDIDLAVRFGKPITLFDLIGAQLSMEDTLGRSVDLVPIDDVYPFVRQSMSEDLIVLYDSNVQGQTVDAYTG